MGGKKTESQWNSQCCVTKIGCVLKRNTYTKQACYRHAHTGNAPAVPPHPQTPLGSFWQGIPNPPVFSHIVCSSSVKKDQLTQKVTNSTAEVPASFPAITVPHPFSLRTPRNACSDTSSRFLLPWVQAHKKTPPDYLERVTTNYTSRLAYFPDANPGRGELLYQEPVIHSNTVDCAPTYA